MAITPDFFDVEGGRQSVVYLAEAAEEKATSIKKGHWYWITAKAATGSIFGDMKVGKAYYSAKDSEELAEGDECYEVSLELLGQANSKELSFSKEAMDVTCDKDDLANYSSDGIVTISGSVNGYNLADRGYTAIKKLRQMFSDVTVIKKEGIETYEARTTEKCVLFFFWNLRDAKEGDIVMVHQVPAFVTEMGIGSEYGSGQTMDLSVQGCASDEDGHLFGYTEVEYSKPVA